MSGYGSEKGGDNHYSSGGNGSVSDSAGISSGLSEVKAIPVKDGEPDITDNQRPKSYQKKISGGFTCGT